jgi:hypothetical protein
MIPKRPVVARDGLDDRNRSSGPLGATSRAGCDRDDDLDDAVWLYAWSHDALHPTGKAVADRVVIAG